MVFGSAVHKGIEERLKFERNPYIVSQLYLEENLAAYSKGIDYSVKEYDDKQELLQTCIKNFEDLFYHDLRQAIVDPINQVELKLETPFRKGFLVGVVDVGMAGIFADWKTGRVPTASALKMDPQSGFYWYLAQKTGLEPPKEFVYVYLTGKNMNYIRSKGGNYRVDSKNPKMQYSFPVFPTEESVNHLLNNYIIPLAKQYEEGVIYKNESDYNCGGCLYRTACKDYDLPSIKD
jgi:hypothetical protein